MAKKSNKTAHVLNLLSGHDAAKEAEEPSKDTEFFDEEAGQTPTPAPPLPEGSGNGGETAASSGTPAPQQNPAPAKAPAASQNSISLIDTTGEDPVADLIQEKLSSEFEKQIQESQAKDSDTIQASIDPEPSSLADEKTDSNESSAKDEGVVSDTDSVEDEKIVSDTGSGENVDAASDTGSVEDEGAVSDTGSGEDEGTSSVGDEKIVSGTGSAEDEGAVSDTGSAEDGKAGIVSEPIESGEYGSEPTQAGQAASESQPVAAPEPEPDFAAVNVMERIVQDKIIYFMRQFDVCTCDRCKADVVALTLNGLMPKYIVTMSAAVDPLISFYTNRLISDVTVEATKACMTVKENPRH